MGFLTNARVERSSGRSSNYRDVGAEMSGLSRFHNGNHAVRNISDSTGEDIPSTVNAAVVCCFGSIMEREAARQLEAGDT